MCFICSREKVRPIREKNTHRYTPTEFVAVRKISPWRKIFCSTTSDGSSHCRTKRAYILATYVNAISSVEEVAVRVVVTTSRVKPTPGSRAKAVNKPARVKPVVPTTTICKPLILTLHSRWSYHSRTKPVVLTTRQSKPVV